MSSDNKNGTDLEIDLNGDETSKYVEYVEVNSYKSSSEELISEEIERNKDIRFKHEIDSGENENTTSMYKVRNPRSVPFGSRLSSRPSPTPNTNFQITTVRSNAQGVETSRKISTTRTTTIKPKVHDREHASNKYSGEIYTATNTDSSIRSTFGGKSSSKLNSVPEDVVGVHLEYNTRHPVEGEGKLVSHEDTLGSAVSSEIRRKGFRGTRRRVKNRISQQVSIAEPSQTSETETELTPEEQFERSDIFKSTQSPNEPELYDVTSTNKPNIAPSEPEEAFTSVRISPHRRRFNKLNFTSKYKTFSTGRPSINPNPVNRKVAVTFPKQLTNLEISEKGTVSSGKNEYEELISSKSVPSDNNEKLHSDEHISKQNGSSPDSNAAINSLKSSFIKRRFNLTSQKESFRNNRPTRTQYSSTQKTIELLPKYTSRETADFFKNKFVPSISNQHIQDQIKEGSHVAEDTRSQKTEPVKSDSAFSSTRTNLNRRRFSKFNFTSQNESFKKVTENQRIPINERPVKQTTPFVSFRQKGMGFTRRPSNYLNRTQKNTAVTQPTSITTSNFRQGHLGPSKDVSDPSTFFRPSHFSFNTRRPSSSVTDKKTSSTSDFFTQSNSYKLFESDYSRRKANNFNSVVQSTSETYIGDDNANTHTEDEFLPSDKFSNAYAQFTPPQFPVYEQLAYTDTDKEQNNPNNGYESYLTPSTSLFDTTSANELNLTTQAYQTESSLLSTPDRMQNSRNSLDDINYTKRVYNNLNMRSDTEFTKGSDESIFLASPKPTYSFTNTETYGNQESQGVYNIEEEDKFITSTEGHQSMISDSKKDFDTPIYGTEELNKPQLVEQNTFGNKKLQKTHSYQQTYSSKHKPSTFDSSSFSSSMEILSESPFFTVYHRPESKRISQNGASNQIVSPENRKTSPRVFYTNTYDSQVINMSTRKPTSDFWSEHEVSSSPPTWTPNQIELSTKFDHVESEETQTQIMDEDSSTSLIKQSDVRRGTIGSTKVPKLYFYSSAINPNSSIQISLSQPNFTSYQSFTKPESFTSKKWHTSLPVSKPLISSPLSTVFDTSNENGQYYHYVMNMGQNPISDKNAKSKIYSTGGALYEILNETGLPYQTSSTEDGYFTLGNSFKVTEMPSSFLKNIAKDINNVESINNDTENLNTTNNASDLAENVSELTEISTIEVHNDDSKTNNFAFTTQPINSETSLNVESGSFLTSTLRPDNFNDSLVNESAVEIIRSESYTTTSATATIGDSSLEVKDMLTPISFSETTVSPSFSDLISNTTANNNSSPLNSLDETTTSITFFGTETTVTETPINLFIDSNNITYTNETALQRNYEIEKIHKSTLVDTNSIKLRPGNILNVSQQESTFLESTTEQYETTLISVGNDTLSLTTTPNPIITDKPRTNIYAPYPEDTDANDSKNGTLKFLEVTNKSKSSIPSSDSVFPTTSTTNNTLNYETQNNLNILHNSNFNKKIHQNLSKISSNATKANDFEKQNMFQSDHRGVTSHPVMELVIQNSDVNDFISKMNDMPVVIKIFNPKTQRYHSVLITPEGKKKKLMNSLNAVTHSETSTTATETLDNTSDNFEYAGNKEHETKYIQKSGSDQAVLGKSSFDDKYFDVFSPTGSFELDTLNPTSTGPHQITKIHSKPEKNLININDLKELLIKSIDKHSEDASDYKHAGKSPIGALNLEKESIVDKLSFLTDLSSSNDKTSNYSHENIPFSVSESVEISSEIKNNNDKKGLEYEATDSPNTFIDPNTEILQEAQVSSPLSSESNDPFKTVLNIMESYRSPKPNPNQEEKAPYVMPLKMETKSNIQPSTDKPLHLIPIYFETGDYETTEESQKVQSFQIPNSAFEQNHFSEQYVPIASTQTPRLFAYSGVTSNKMDDNNNGKVLTNNNNRADILDTQDFGELKWISQGTRQTPHSSDSSAFLIHKKISKDNNRPLINGNVRSDKQAIQDFGDFEWVNHGTFHQYSRPDTRLDSRQQITASHQHESTHNQNFDTQTSHNQYLKHEDLSHPYHSSSLSDHKNSEVVSGNFKMPKSNRKRKNKKRRIQKLRRGNSPRYTRPDLSSDILLQEASSNNHQYYSLGTPIAADVPHLQQFTYRDAPRRYEDTLNRNTQVLDEVVEGEYNNKFSEELTYRDVQRYDQVPESQVEREVKDKRYEEFISKDFPKRIHQVFDAKEDWEYNNKPIQEPTYTDSPGQSHKNIDVRKEKESYKKISPEPTFEDNNQDLYRTPVINNEVMTGEKLTEASNYRIAPPTIKSSIPLQVAEQKVYHILDLDEGMKKNTRHTEKRKFRTIPQYTAPEESPGVLFKEPSNTDYQSSDTYSSRDVYAQDTEVFPQHIHSGTSSDIQIQESKSDESESPVKYVKLIPYVEPKRMQLTTVRSKIIPQHDKFILLDDMNTEALKSQVQQKRSSVSREEDGIDSHQVLQKNSPSTDIDDDMYPKFKTSVARYGRRLS
ncbi:uncharacterized protein NPIL_58911 [Nephila pilipes]|uniref:Uncharacterized protein n=1 Tax=Nephila pilipes TaxID=299642 RepID=A0A8X6PY33_NEPPI|nr:uncharacterized protein NPIL_58911 [Nephila pilipes]